MIAGHLAFPRPPSQLERVTQVQKWKKMLGIFFRHLAAFVNSRRQIYRAS